MDWHEVVNDALPPPRGDEPGDLRQNIADELADHFHCALRREQLRLGDENAAHRAALQKFGDPKLLAYRLWFDAMKKHRRFRTAACVSAVVCLFVVAAWYVSCFRGGYVAVTTNDLTTYRIGIQEAGNLCIYRAVSIRGVGSGWRSGTMFPYSRRDTPPGVPWFEWEHDGQGDFQYLLVQVPLWFLALCAAILPALYGVNQCRQSKLSTLWVVEQCGESL